MITISDRAASEALRILTEQGKPGAMVRVWIAGVGCSGFRYGLGIDEKEPGEGDQVFDSGGLRLVVDAESMKNLGGARLQWVDDAENAGFSIDNPNPAPACTSGCCDGEEGHEGSDGSAGEADGGGCCG